MLGDSTQRGPRQLGVVALLIAAAIFLAPARLHASPCTGDCNVNAEVTVDELSIGVNIGLGNPAPVECPIGVFDQTAPNGEVTVGELLTAVNRALTDCHADFIQASSGIVNDAPLEEEHMPDPIIDFGLVTNPTAARFIQRSAGVAAGNADFSDCLCPDGGTAFAFCDPSSGDSVLNAFLSDCSAQSRVRNGSFTLTVADPDFCTTCAIPPDVEATQILDSGFTITDSQTVSEVIDPVIASFTLGDSGCAGSNRSTLSNGVVRVTGPDTDVTYEYLGVSTTIQSNPEGSPCTTTTTKSGQTRVDNRAADRRFLETASNVVLTETPLEDGGREVTLDTPSDGSLRIDCLGEIRLSTLAPLVYGSDAPCPSDGLVEVTFMNQSGVTATRYTPEGVDFDFDFQAGEFTTDQHFDDCRAADIKQCTVDLPFDPNAPPIEQALENLARGNLRAANDTLRDILDDTPDDPQANLFYAVTRLPATFLDNPEIADLFARSDITVSGDSTDVCNLHFVGSEMEPPPDAPGTGELIDTICAVMLPELIAARQNLAQVPPETVTPFLVSHLPPCLRPETDRAAVELDRGDVLLLDSALATTAGLVDLLSAYDLDISQERGLTDRDILLAHPSLLTLHSADRLGAARTSFSDAFSLGIEAINEIIAEHDDQTDDLITIEPDDAMGFSEQLGPILGLFQQSLDGQVAIPIDAITGQLMQGSSERLNLSLLFSGQLGNLRGFLPGFDDHGDFSGPVPDPTFGGTVADMTQTKLDNFLIGGPPCAPCDDGRGCHPEIGDSQFSCSDCFSDCTGMVRRCASGVTQCSDGVFVEGNPDN